MTSSSFFGIGMGPLLTISSFISNCELRRSN
jgi:hypothetical protein